MTGRRDSRTVGRIIPLAAVLLSVSSPVRLSAQASLHAKNPRLYAEKPKWNFAVLEEAVIPGLLPTDDFKFFRYKA